MRMASGNNTASKVDQRKNKPQATAWHTFKFNFKMESVPNCRGLNKRTRQDVARQWRHKILSNLN